MIQAIAARLRRSGAGGRGRARFTPEVVGANHGSALEERKVPIPLFYFDFPVNQQGYVEVSPLAGLTGGFLSGPTYGGPGTSYNQASGSYSYEYTAPPLPTDIVSTSSVMSQILMSNNPTDPPEQNGYSIIVTKSDFTDGEKFTGPGIKNRAPETDGTAQTVNPNDGSGNVYFHLNDAVAGGINLSYLYIEVDFSIYISKAATVQVGPDQFYNSVPSLTFTSSVVDMQLDGNGLTISDPNLHGVHGGPVVLSNYPGLQQNGTSGVFSVTNAAIIPVAEIDPTGANEIKMYESYNSDYGASFSGTVAQGSSVSLHSEFSWEIDFKLRHSQTP